MNGRFSFVRQSNTNTRITLYRTVWPLSLMLTILWASGTAGPEFPGRLIFPHFDKVAHFFIFGLIGTLVYRAVYGWPDRLKAMLFAVALTALFGALDEFRQSLNPRRYAEYADWLIDALGATIAVAAYTRWTGYRNLLERRVFVFRRRRDGGRRTS